MQHAQIDEQPPVVFFFHGLNTFGDDLLHLGPVNLGRMDRYVKPALESRGLNVYSIDGVGARSAEEQARLASRQIAKLAHVSNSASVNLLGNSSGGLVVRSLARLWTVEPELNVRKLKIDRIISWGTPHKGTQIADIALKISKDHPTFSHYSLNALSKFNEIHPLNAFAPEFCFTCEVDFRDLSPYFYPYYLVHNSAQPPRPSDGFITVENQKWGRAIGPFRLDHFGQIGFSEILATRSQRERSRKEFMKLCDAMSDLVRSPVEVPARMTARMTARTTARITLDG